MTNDSIRSTASPHGRSPVKGERPHILRRCCKRNIPLRGRQHAWVQRIRPIWLMFAAAHESRFGRFLPKHSSLRTADDQSQVAQEVEYVLLVRCAQHIERTDHLVGFRAVAGMLFDGS